MNFNCQNGKLTIVLEGRIDSANAEKAGAEIDAVFNDAAAAAATDVCLDASKLDYISSAGLRVVLKLRKQHDSLHIIGASADIYDIFEMTGFTELMPVEKAYRQFSVEGCKILGQGAKGTVYRYNADTIVKVYKNPDSLPDIKNERELARRAFVLGIPTAISYDIVKVGESFGSVFELLDAKSYSQLIVEDRANRDRYIAEYALLLKKIHETMVKAEDMPDMKVHVLRWLQSSSALLDAADVAKLQKLIEETPDTLNMLHCDYHTNNVMSQNGETLLIDMDTLSHGHPIFELANVYITYVGFGIENHAMVENFIGMPYEDTCYIWQKFLPVYLGTENSEKLKEVEEKAKILADLRYMHHLVKRGQETDELGQKIISRCQKEIAELLPHVQSFDF